MSFVRLTIAAALFLAVDSQLDSGLVAAEPEPPLHRFEFKSAHMGTVFSISLFATNQLVAENAADAAFHRIVDLENIMSDYQADSELNLLREKPIDTPVPVSEDLFAVLRQSQQLSRLSEGAFDVTVGPYVRLWRFARKRGVLPTPSALEKAGQAVGWRKLVLNGRRHTVTLLARDMQLDLGGIAKGFAADRALEVIKGHGIDRALVAASGDIVVGEPPPGQSAWHVAISGLNTNSGSNTNPATSPILWLRNSAVSTSGDTEQYLEIEGVRYSHIVSPTTGLGLTNRIQATVVAPNGSMSDPLATTVCILGPRTGLKLIESLKGTAALVITSTNGDLTMITSRRFGMFAAMPK